MKSKRLKRKNLQKSKRLTGSRKRSKRATGSRKRSKRATGSRKRSKRATGSRKRSKRATGSRKRSKRATGSRKRSKRAAGSRKRSKRISGKGKGKRNRKQKQKQKQETEIAEDYQMCQKLQPAWEGNECKQTCLYKTNTPIKWPYLDNTNKKDWDKVFLANPGQYMFVIRCNQNEQNVIHIYPEAYFEYEEGNIDNLYIKMAYCNAPFDEIHRLNVHHDCLANGNPVIMAGMLYVKEDGTYEIDNTSGHYTPAQLNLNYAKKLFNELGFNVEISKSLIGNLKPTSNIVINKDITNTPQQNKSHNTFYNNRTNTMFLNSFSGEPNTVYKQQKCRFVQLKNNKTNNTNTNTTKSTDMTLPVCAENPTTIANNKNIERKKKNEETRQKNKNKKQPTKRQVDISKSEFIKLWTQLAVINASLPEQTEQHNQTLHHTHAYPIKNTHRYSNTSSTRTPPQRR
jgi:hypothetical protein